MVNLFGNCSNDKMAMSQEIAAKDHIPRLPGATKIHHAKPCLKDLLC